MSTPILEPIKPIEMPQSVPSPTLTPVGGTPATPTLDGGSSILAPVAPVTVGEGWAAEARKLLNLALMALLGIGLILGGVAIIGLGAKSEIIKEVAS